ncbi:MAG: cytochrome P450 [Gammaproteobacteria bacterium]|nr:cytochrome P450 [Gammaproteobacteria bacterium]MYG95833.1 cytochrome P450 [Gammaproteobacteria bacterium]
MRLTEELILLMLNEDTGYLEMEPGWTFSCVIAGSVIADLAMENRIDADLEKAILIDPTPVGDDLLDPTLDEFAKAKNTHDAQYWVEKNTRRADEILTQTLQRLVNKKVLNYETGGFWSLTKEVKRSKTYPANLKLREEARTRILNVIMDESIPDPRDAILINLLHNCNGFSTILTQEDYTEKLEHIELVCKLDLVGQAISKAVKQSVIDPKIHVKLKANRIPKLSFMDILRQRDFWTGNISKAICGVYEKHGPVVEVPIKVRKKRLVALMGPKANTWVHKHGRFYMRSKDYIEHFERSMGASKSLPGLDGPEHYKMRKSLSTGYSRATLANRLPELIHRCDTSIGRWNQGDVIPGTRTFQNHISSQVSHFTIGIDCSEYVDDLLAYMHRALVVHVQGGLPKLMMYTPRMIKARKSIHRMINDIHASHTPAQRKGKPPDLADYLLDLHRNDPMFLPETDLSFPIAAAMVASIYLGSALAFSIYSMVRDPALYDKVYQEAESIFGNGRQPSDDDFTFDNASVANRLWLECQRAYPVIPWQLRTTMNSCIVEGYKIPANTMILLCQTASHYLDSLYKDPSKFDIDRYLPDREEHMAPGAYAPYGLGTHTCLGHRWVDLQMTVNILMIAHRLKLEIAPADYRLGINPFPTCAPNRKLKFKVVEVRNSAEG